MNGMEKKQETKKTKSLTQKAKKIRSIIMMTLLCVLMMSAATYAWFTLSNTAKATNLTMTVGDTTGLQIAKVNAAGDGPDTYKSMIELDTIKGKVLPATTNDGSIFYKPEYTDGDVTGNTQTDVFLSKDNTENDKEGYYIQYKFYLKALGEDTDIKLAEGSGFDNGIYAENSQGTYILWKKPDDDTSTTLGVAAGAIRLSFKNTTSGGNATVFEPNSDLDSSSLNFQKGADFATDSRTNDKITPATVTVKHFKNGTIETDGPVLHLDHDTDSLIELNVWIEGTDDQCVNQISAKNLIGQLVFTKEE